MWDDEGGAADEEQRRRTAGSATFQASAAEREQKEGIAVVGIAEKEKDSNNEEDVEDAENDSKNRKSVVSVPKLDSAAIHALKSSHVKNWGEYTEQPDDEDSKSTASLEYFEAPDANSFQTLRLWTEIDGE